MNTVQTTEALRFAAERPNRPLLVLLLQYFEYIAPVGVCAILLVGAFPYAPLWTALWAGLYLAYTLVKNRLRQYVGPDFYYSHWIQVVRVLVTHVTHYGNMVD